MKATANINYFLCLSGLSIILSGCSGSNWLVGKWQLDKDKTMKTFTGQTESAQSGDDEKNDFTDKVGGFFKSVGKGLTGALLDEFAYSSIEFTRSEVRMMNKGKGEAVVYEIIERPASGVLVIKLADGEIVTWHREGEYIKQAAYGKDSAWLYFKREE